ncbi:NUDIX hydrolase [Rhodopirellula sp. P2]|uniref:NUDIX hydrolase n=1 Tax=Rhodopirellula sp. P2 TaxID=2127060 RepID=UPI002367AC4E|nr:NUDIX domain-containing protein [Rhodopirellula sp. P2]WDQ16681.1 NUDIX domain-containing protein [Rhodopirellula sp. P2]
MKKKPSAATVKKTAKKSASRKSAKKSSRKSTRTSHPAAHQASGNGVKKSASKKVKKSVKKKAAKKSAVKSVRKQNPKPTRRSQEPIEQAFRYCPSCQTPSEHLGAIPFRCGECGFAFFFGPVAAVGGLIVNEAQQLLLVRRARDPGKGQWGLPGGFVDRGESIEEALRREVIEETQLEVTELTLLTTGPNTYTYAGVTADVIDLFFVCKVPTDAKIQLEPTELTEFKWCVPSKRELNNMAFPSNRIAVEQWLRERKQASK